MPLRQSRSCQGFNGDNTSADSSLWFASSSSSSMFIDDQSSGWRASYLIPLFGELLHWRPS